MKVLIFSGMGFTNLKEYSSSKWFQFSWMAVKWSSLVDWAFSWTFFSKFPSKFSIEFRSELFVCYGIVFFYMLFLKKSSKSLCSVIIILIITKPILHRWYKKITQDFSVHVCIDGWVMIDFSSCPLNNMKPYIIKKLYLYLFSSGSHFYVSFELYQIKVLASSSWPKLIFNLSLNITFIQLSTRHDCFSWSSFNHISYSLYVGFWLAFLCVNPILFNRLTVLSPISCFHQFAFLLLYILYFQGI